MKKNIKLIAAVFLLGIQTLMGSFMGSFRMPKDFDLLTESEKEEYNAIQAIGYRRAYKYARGRANAVFLQLLREVLGFVDADPTRKNIRGFICGIMRNGRFIARNTVQVSYLLDKSKASINADFIRLGYKIVPNSSKRIEEVFPVFNRVPKHAKRCWVLIEFPEAVGQETSEVVPLTALSEQREDAASFFNDEGFEFFNW
ncbi:MAG: hypothetical protein LBF34_00180 [Puniceicoccales bacterium]|jgi:hypothetical protein|nr:hypothetical protein [Puniceicoccales bacterium]